MTASFEEILKEHTSKIRCLALRVSRGQGGTQQIDGLIAAGNLALWQCYERFDSKRMPEDAFWMYAYRRVQGAMQDVLRSQDGIGRYGRKQIKNNGLEGVPWAAIYRVSTRFLDGLPSSSDPYQDLMVKCDCTLARKLVSALSYRHQCVIHMYFVEDMKLWEIGERLGVTEARVSQLKNEALAFMQAQAKGK